MPVAFVGVVAMLCAGAPAGAAARRASVGGVVAAARAANEFEPGTVLLGLRSGVSGPRRRRLEALVGARSARLLDGATGRTVAARRLRERLGFTYVLRIGRRSVRSAVRILLAQRPLVTFAEPDYLMQAGPAAAEPWFSPQLSPNPASGSVGTVSGVLVPNDPSFPAQWGSLNTGQTVNAVTGVAGADDGAAAAWTATTGSRSIVVGEVDTGVDYTDPDLAANVWSNPGGVGGCAAGTHGYDVLTSTCNPLDQDTSYNGHGTHVAGIIGAVGNNGIGVAGMNWATTILPVRWLSTENGGGTTSQLISALNWELTAAQAGVNVRVVNDSSVYPGTAFSQALSDEIDLLGASNILFVTAAGNQGVNIDSAGQQHYPCGYARPTEICATASNQSDQLASNADWGPTSVNLAAPGQNIYSTLRGGAYGYISGGSMAAAQVSGAAALVLSAANLSVTALKADLLGSTDPLSSLAGKVSTGGRLDVCKAIADTGSATCPPLPPTAVLSVSPTAAQVGQPVSFSGAGSTDPQGTILSEQINFGDGSPVASSPATHSYAQPGSYLASLLVTDSYQNTARATQTVVVTAATTTTTTPTPTTTPATTTTAPPPKPLTLTVSFASQTLARALGHGLLLTVTPSLSGHLELAAQLGWRVARQVGLEHGRARKSVTVASLSDRALSGRAGVGLVFTHAARVRLAHLRHLWLTVVATFTAGDGRVVTRSTTIALFQPPRRHGPRLPSAVLRALG